MDGNGRWAKKRFLPRFFGHKAGVDSLVKVVQACIDRDIEYLTVFAFSSENWKRPAEEVGTLMKLFLRMLDTEIEEMHRRGVCIRFIGQRSDFAAEIAGKMDLAEQLTAGNRLLRLNIAGS